MAGEQPKDWRTFVAEASRTGGFEPALTETTVVPSALPGIPHGSPNFDPIDLLPEERKDFLRKLGQRRADAHAVRLPFEDIREASMRKIAAASERKRLTDPAGDGGFNLPDDDVRVVAATKTLAKATDEFNRQQELQQVRSAAFQSAGAALANVETWLKSGVPGNCTIEAVEIEPPTLLKDESIIDAVERFRRRGRELKADAHRIRSAPYPSAHAKRKMREQVEQLSQRGEPSVSRLVELDGPAEFQTQNLRSTVHGEQRALAFAETPDALALIAWLHRDALIKRFDELIDAEADDKSALSHEAREKAEAETMGDLLDIERQEAELTWLAQSQNLPVEHRADISPLALLGVRLVTTPRGEAPETTPGLSWPRR